MSITRSAKVISNDGSQTPQNSGYGVAQFNMKEARLMMQTMLDQQRHDFWELLTQELATSKGGALVINKLILIEQVTNQPFPTHEPTIQEGNSDSKSNQESPPPERQEVRKNDEPRVNATIRTL